MSGQAKPADALVELVELLCKKNAKIERQQKIIDNYVKFNLEDLANSEYQISVIIASQNVLDIWQNECASPGRLDIAMEDLEKALKKVKDTP
jgi:hypothetical protein